MSSEKPEVFTSTKRCMEDRMMELEVENSRLQQLVAELLLKNQQLRDAHLPSPNHTGKFDQNRSRPHAEGSLPEPHPVSKSDELTGGQKEK